MKLKKLFSLSLAAAMLLSTAALPVAAGETGASVTVVTATGGTATAGTQSTTGTGKNLRYVWEGTVENLTAGTKVGACATPDTGYKFKSWNATGVTLTTEQQTSNTLIFTMGDTDVTLLPVFEACTESVLVRKAVPFYWDFENASAAAYGSTSMGTAWEGGRKQTTELSTYSRFTDAEHGRSLVLGSNTSNYVNTDTTSQISEKDWVFGFETYLTQTSQFALSGLGKNNTTDNIKEVIKVEPQTQGNPKIITHTGKQRYGESVEFDNVEEQLTDGQMNDWHKFNVAISYNEQKVTVYMDNKLLSTVEMNDAFDNTKRWNFNKAANVMFDNVYGYYRDAATIAGDTNITAEETSTYDITTTQLLSVAENATATLTPKSGTAVTATASVAVDKTTSTITLSGLDGKLEQDTEYSVTFTGITDLFGGAINHSFKTRSTRQTINVTTTETGTLFQDTIVNIKITTHNIPDGDALVVTQNGTRLEPVTIVTSDAEDNTFEKTIEVTLVGGENKFEVTYGDIKGTLIMNTRKFETVETMVDTDFGEDFTESDDNVTLGKCKITDTGDAAHGKALRFEGTDSPYILLQKKDAKSVENGVIIAEGDFNTTDNTTFEIFKVKSTSSYKDSSGKTQYYWSQPFYVENLKLYLKPEGGGKDQHLETLTAGTWYRFKVIFDVDENTMTLILNDRVLVSNHPANYNDEAFKGFQYINQRLKVNNNDANAGYWLDNVKCRIAVGNYGYTLTDEHDKERVSVNGTIHVNFTEEMDGSTLNGLTVEDESGNTVAASGTLSEDKKTYAIPVSGLNYNAPYTVKIPATVKTANGAGGASGSKVIWSEKADFSIDTAKIAKSNATTATVNVMLNGTTNNDGYIAIYAFAGSKLLDLSYLPVNNGDINGTLRALNIANAPEGETVTYGTVLFEGFGNLKCIDFIEPGDIK